jgi:hypothetical protein
VSDFLDFGFLDSVGGMLSVSLSLWDFFCMGLLGVSYSLSLF